MMTISVPQTSDVSPAPTLQDIQAASFTIKSHVMRTPTLPAHKLSQLTGAEVFVKYENLQRTGAFKERGALNRLLALSEDERKRGVIAMSAGNHAQAVACHAERLGIPATIVMPQHTPFMKVANTESYGAEVLLAGEGVAEAYEKAIAIAEERGLSFVHPYDDPLVIMGQGTLGIEMLEDQPDLDCAVFQIGGGGLISGCAVAMKALKPNLQIFGAQTTAYPSMKAALEGKTSQTHGGSTLAEGIAVKTVGKLTLPIVSQFVEDVILASEAQIECAVSSFVSLQKTIAEGAGAAGLAALLSEPERFQGRKVGIVLTGANIDTRVLASILVRSLEREQKVVSLRLIVNDQPGTLGRIASCLGECGANILEVLHQRRFLDVPAKGASLDLTIEVKDAAHCKATVAALQNLGFTVIYIEETSNGNGNGNGNGKE
jgi:threonine dehydratase